MLDRVIWAYGAECSLDFTLIRPFNWIGPGLDSLYTAKEGSSRVMTQFLGHIVRGENISLVDGGRQRRTFTYVDDGVDALMAIIENKNQITSGQIYNIGNPANQYSVRELGEMMVTLALEYPEYAGTASKVQFMDVSSSTYYGEGYQDVQHRVPAIANTCRDLNWLPKTAMDQMLRLIFDSYRGQIAQARALLE